MRIFFFLLVGLFLIVRGTLFSAIQEENGESEAFVIQKPAFVEDSSADSESAEESRVRLKSGEELKRKVNIRAAFYSLAVPGLGEMVVGRPTLGKSLMVLDGLTWIALGTAFIYRSELMDDLRAYLYANAGCDGTHSFNGKTAHDLSESELELPLYADSSGYYERRVYLPSRDSYMQKADFFWRWNSETAHQRYYDMWGKANRVRVVGYYFLGAAVINRIISFINTGRMIRKMGAEQPASVPPALGCVPDYDFEHPGYRLVLHF